MPPASLALPVIRKLSTKVSTVPVARQLIALATDRMGSPETLDLARQKAERWFHRFIRPIWQQGHTSEGFAAQREQPDRAGTLGGREATIEGCSRLVLADNADFGLKQGT